MSTPEPRGLEPGRLDLAAARDAAGLLLRILQREPSAMRLAVAGPIRRMTPEVACVDLLATAYEPDALLRVFREMHRAVSVLEERDDYVRIRLHGGGTASLTAIGIEDDAFFPLLVHRTGSEAHLAALRKRAVRRGLRLEERGLYRGEERLPARNEQALYKHLGVPFRPPELREDDDLEAVPRDLVTMADVRGLMVLAEPTGEDLELLAERVAMDGFAWTVGPGPFVPEPERHQPAARVFHGVEVGIDADGALVDHPGLDEADVVWARLTGPGDEAPRLARAASDARVRIVCHPEGIGLSDAGWHEVFLACAEHGTALELSASLERTALDRRWHAAARSHGVSLVPAAHTHGERAADQAIAALGAARRGAWRVGDVVPALTADDFVAWCRSAAG